MYDTGGELYFDDARKIVPEQLPDFDLLVGGFPCQSFSIAGARKGFEVINNVKKIISIEFLCAAQGIDFLRPLKSGKGSEKAYTYIRRKIKHIKEDTISSELILKISEIIYDERFLKSVEEKTGKLK